MLNLLKTLYLETTKIEIREITVNCKIRIPNNTQFLLENIFEIQIISHNGTEDSLLHPLVFRCNIHFTDSFNRADCII